VKYVYGTIDDKGPTKGNRAGRLKSLSDGSGVQEYTYGKQGEVTEQRRTLVIPNQAVATYVTKTAYDSWNRLVSMTYPDNEVVNYTYNTGGLLTGVASTSNVYVADVKYDKFEQRTKLTYGNGAVTNYTYNDSTRNLQNLGVLSTKINKQIMNNTYKFDRVGNIVNIQNNATTANNMGGVMIHNYQYDNLYRLKHADGNFTGANAKTAKYALEMGYDNMHNIISKSQHIEQVGVQFDGTLKAGYDLNYTINAGNCQQISNIAENSYRTEGTQLPSPQGEGSGVRSEFSYDTNGNLLSINTGTKQGDKLKVTNTRKLLWDEENHLLASCDNGYLTSYYYDAAGERTVKMSGDAEGVFVNGLLSGGRTGTANFTAYLSPYLNVRNGGEYTKHIYMGSQRITSKVSDSGIFKPENNPVKDTLQGKYTAQTAALKMRYDSLGVQYKGVEKSGSIVSSSSSGLSASYFYHSDHLGSSSLITDVSGDIVQHVEYVPFGGTFIDERRSLSSWHTPFLFSGKERDEETGLLYVSQRYQDEKYGIWYSVDQLAEKYPNISSYVYVENNPIKYIDPDGREKIISLNPNVEKNTHLINAANKYPDDKAVHLWIHGDSRSMYVYDEVKKTDIRISTPKQFETFLSKNSKTWKNKGENDHTTIILHACETGKDNENAPSYAAVISKSLKNTNIIAPTEKVVVNNSNDTEIGSYSTKTVNLNGKNTEILDQKGSWVNLLNGNKTETHSGDWQPMNKPEVLTGKFSLIP
jgi:RHS repeat-associated protein